MMEDKSNPKEQYFSLPIKSNAYSGLLVDSVGFDLIGSHLGKELESALEYALAGGVVFSNGTNPLSIFRQVLSDSIFDIEIHPRGQLFQEFLLKGPYEDIGEIPIELAGQRLSDDETASTITFIYSHRVNCFKGALAELLASKPCLLLLRKLKQNGTLPANAQLYIGDVVSVHRNKGKGYLKGADQYILLKENKQNETSNIIVAGMTEVKSYIQSKKHLCKQLNQHIQRAKRGLQVNGVDYSADKIKIGYGRDRQIVQVTVLPSVWKLPRSYRYVNSENGKLLHLDRGDPPKKIDVIKQTADTEWHITLRWSMEALAEAAYEMTFWYMEKIWEVIYSKSMPKGWENMSPSEAGRNAAKMMLYYAILRCHNVREEQRAIALYNSYGFGYSIGMNYKNVEGKREMLWPQDLDEILIVGKTRHGCTLH